MKKFLIFTTIFFLSFNLKLASSQVFIKAKVNNKIILFIHIPKCGGTTIEENLNALQPNKKITLEHQKLNLEMLWGQHKNFQLQHLTFSQVFNEYKYAHNKGINDIDFIFSIVRNPIDIIIYEANWQISHQYLQYNF